MMRISARTAVLLVVVRRIGRLTCFVRVAEPSREVILAVPSGLGPGVAYRHDERVDRLLPAHVGNGQDHRHGVVFEVLRHVPGDRALRVNAHALGRRVERQLHAEVDAVLTRATATLEDIPRLELTGRILTETLRMYPPGFMFTRVTTKDFDLGGHRIAAGTTIVYSAYLLHHRDDLFPDAGRFDPGRWTGGQARQLPMRRERSPRRDERLQWSRANCRHLN